MRKEHSGRVAGSILPPDRGTCVQHGARSVVGPGVLPPAVALSSTTSRCAAGGSLLATRQEHGAWRTPALGFISSFAPFPLCDVGQVFSFSAPQFIHPPNGIMMSK